MRLFYFTPEQAADLDAHLKTAIEDETDRRTAVATADFACADAALELRAESREPGFSRAWRAQHHQRMGAVRQHAAELQRLLGDARPLVNTAGLDWPVFDRALETIRESADAETEATKPRSGAGRPLEDWRDRLIAAVRGAYPPHADVLTRGSHFERTIEIALGFLDREDVGDLHVVIEAALHRRPTSPFTVTAHRQLRILR